MPIVSKVATGVQTTSKGSGQRGTDIRWIIPHHLVAHWTAMYAAKYFCNNGLDNSVNYCIGYDGSCVCNVYEDYGPWTSSNSLVDYYSLTIECSDTSTTDYTIPKPTQETLINLMVDFIQRYPSLGGKAVYDPSDATEVMKAKAEKRLPKTKGNILLHKWTSGGTTSCPEWHMIQILPSICEEVNRRLTNKTKKQKYIDALRELGDGRYHYYDGKAMGIGCSEYTRLSLLKAGIIREGETFHAASGNVGVLADTTRFQKIPWSANNLAEADIMWSQGHHVATWDGVNGVYEAAPESTHGICDNGKTGVGHFSKHTYYNCGTGTKVWTCLYRIIETSMKRTLHEEAQYIIDNGINGANRKAQARADGFNPDDVQAEIDKMLGKNPLDNDTVVAGCMAVVKKGSANASVYVLQLILQYMGYYTGNADGQFGDLTEKALKQYQQNINKVYKNMAVDGVCGQKTWTRLLAGK